MKENNIGPLRFLFLDRDGVINIEKHMDYIHHWDEFHFYAGALEAIAGLSKIFERIVVVTNQKGVGKGLTKPGDLAQIHANMQAAIEAAGGKIDAIFFCPDLENDSPNRKPNPGMAFQAKALFPEIDFNQSLMVGNNLSDLQFGRNAGMKTAFVRTTQPNMVLPPSLADLDIKNLPDLLQWLRSNA